MPITSRSRRSSWPWSTGSRLTPGSKSETQGGNGNSSSLAELACDDLLASRDSIQIISPMLRHGGSLGQVLDVVVCRAQAVTGEAVGKMFLKYLRSKETSGGDADLTHMMLGWLRQMVPETATDSSEAVEPQTGQMVGFLYAIGPWLFAGVKQFGRSLDNLDDRALLWKANSGLDLDEQAYVKEVSAQRGYGMSA
jgi:hypothetical protein